MFAKGEIARGTQGALRFLQRDPAAPFHFENTPEACLRSFQVMVLVAPIYMLYLMISYSRLNTIADTGEVALVEALHYVVDWLLYPWLFYEIARWRGWLDRYPRYIAALNWIGLPAIVVALIGSSIASIAPTAVAITLDLALRALFIYWFIMATRLTLGVSWLYAVALAVVNWAPSLILSRIVDGILGVGFTPA